MKQRKMRCDSAFCIFSLLLSIEFMRRSSAFLTVSSTSTRMLPDFCVSSD